MAKEFRFSFEYMGATYTAIYDRNPPGRWNIYRGKRKNAKQRVAFYYAVDGGGQLMYPTTLRSLFIDDLVNGRIG